MRGDKDERSQGLDSLPLLFFPRKTTSVRTPRGGGNTLIYPSQKRQVERIGPAVERIESAFESHRVNLQRNPAEIDPEMVLVVEIVGEVPEFERALEAIGMEALGDWDEKTDPDDDFYIENSKTGQRTGARPSVEVFLSMTDKRAMDQFRALWGWFKEEMSKGQFPPTARKWWDIFSRMRSIRAWGPEDRLRATGIIERIQLDLDNGQSQIVAETECWYSGRPGVGSKRIEKLRKQVESLGGEVVRSTTRDEIHYLGAIVRIPREAFDGYQVPRDLFHNELDVDVVRTFAPVGQSVIHLQGEPIDTTNLIPLESDELSLEAPTIALLDGLPLENHRLLQGRVIVDDPDGLSDAYQAVSRVHGTAMASLILHGDLGGEELPLETRVYVRPVMRPAPIGSRYVEEFPSDRLMVDMLWTAFRRMFEREYGGPVAPTVKVVNISLSESGRLFEGQMSPLARMLDWLAWHYDVLFLVCAGNYQESLRLNADIDKGGNLTSEELQSLVLEGLRQDLFDRRITSPGEAINALTVGASYDDQSSLGDLPAIAKTVLQDPRLPSPMSRFGSGHSYSVKPDLLFPGGRPHYRSKLHTNHGDLELTPLDFGHLKIGQKVASPGREPGQLDGVAYSFGTSNATALASRQAGRLLEMLEVYNTLDVESIPDEYLAVVLKALMVHSAIHGEETENLEKAFEGIQNRGRKAFLSRLIGFGSSNPDRVLGCTPQRVTVVGYSSFTAKNEMHSYSLPIPDVFASVGARKRVTRTLAWNSAIRASSRDYRATVLGFGSSNKQVREDLKCDSPVYDHHAVRRGTVLHESFETHRATAIADTYDLWLNVECSRHPEGTKPTKYALAVTIEFIEEVEAQIYEEVRDRIRPRVQIVPS